MRNRPSLLARLLGRLNKKPIEKPSTPARPFQAISIFRGGRACEMAHRFSEHRFLARDAPSLPLIGCTMAESCECSYIRHKDRRSDPRRLMDFGARSYKGRERRTNPDRRSNDDHR